MRAEIHATYRGDLTGRLAGIRSRRFQARSGRPFHGGPAGLQRKVISYRDGIEESCSKLQGIFDRKDFLSIF